ncbi:MAG: CHAD domain-containing protein, partial [Cyanobium sp.]
LARRTGEARDLDVLDGRLRDQLLPRLEPADQPALAPLLRRLTRRRQRAFAAALAALAAPRTTRLLRKIDRWQRQPRFTALGHESLADWLHDWHRPLSGSLVLHPGWWAEHPRDLQLHALRKRIKGLRYSLEALVNRLEPSGRDWIAAFKQAQTVLGELHDLQVLEALLHEEQARIPASASQGVQAELERQRAIAWARWRELSGWLLRPECRAALPSLSPLPTQQLVALPVAAGP